MYTPHIYIHTPNVYSSLPEFNKAAIGKSGTKAVLKAMSDFPRDPTIQAAACYAIVNLCGKDG